MWSRKWVAVLALAILVSGCRVVAPSYETPSDFAIIFRTGFEPGEAEGVPASAHEEITYQNTAELPPPEHYEIPRPATVPVSYQAGTVDDRFARIIEDPTQGGNHVLHFWLRNPVIPATQSHTKGRVQNNFGLGDHPDGDVVVELYAAQRVRLHPDFGIIIEYDRKDDWWLEPMIHELWMENDFLSSRIGIYVVEAEANQLYPAASLTHRTHDGELWQPGWEEVGSVSIPVDEWFTMEVGWKMGDADTGRFILTIQRESDGDPLTAIDKTDWTYNPNSQRPIPLAGWNPQKLYASDNIVDFVRDKGGILQLYFDDFEFADSLPDRWR